MGTDDRLKNILRRQAAAVALLARENAEAKVAAEAANKLRDSVSQKWKVQRAHLVKFVAQLNLQTSKNGVVLFVKDSAYPAPVDASELDKMEVGFQQDVREMRKLTISVRPDGKMHVTMTTRYASPAKNYVLDALEATNDQLEGTALDFLDINTPPEKDAA
jgi:hypothetical protein